MVRIAPEKSEPADAAIEPTRHFINVPSGRTVIGREVEIAQLAENLGQTGEAQVTNSGAILAGQGGIGKTTLARGYAESRRAEYAGVLRVNATSRQAVIERLVPQGSHLIATTRQGEGWPGFAVQDADVLAFDTEDGAAVALLMAEAGRDDGAAGARALVERLGGLPLALVMAGGLIRKEGLGFADYLDQVDRIIAREEPNGDCPDSVIGAVRLSYNRLEADARLVADIFSWWAPEGLEARLTTDATLDPSWEQYKDDIPEEVPELAQSPERVAAAVTALEERSIFRRGAAGFELHRMSAAALRAMQGNTPLNGAAAALLAAEYPAKAGESGNWTACRRLTPHLRSLWASGAAPAIAAMDYLLNQAAIFLGKTGDFEGSAEMAQAALELKTSRRAVALDAEHRPGFVDLAISHDLLGGLLLDKGRGGDVTVLRAALREYQKSAAILRRQVPWLSDARAQVLNNLGTVRDALGQGAAALRFYEYSLAILRQVLPSGDARLGYRLMNVGALALKHGAADRAEGLLGEALELWQAVYLEAPKHEDIVDAAGWLVSCLLVRAAAGENAGLRQMKAQQLCADFGFDFDERVERAKQYPYAP